MSASRLTATAARFRARWWWQPDKWERLGTVVRLVEETDADVRSVLDVGGRGHELHDLLPSRRVVSANVEEPCDVLLAAGPLPFDDDAFDVVTSTDVLEHMPHGQRAEHVGELVRVARRRVVICFPSGSATKDASEQRLAVVLAREYGVRFDFLDEHLAHGLPRAADVVSSARAAAPWAAVHVVYQDGVDAAEQLLLDAVGAVKGRRPGAAFRSARAWLVRRRPTLTAVTSEDNSRAYVVIDLATPAPG